MSEQDDALDFVDSLEMRSAQATGDTMRYIEARERMIQRAAERKAAAKAEAEASTEEVQPEGDREQDPAQPIQDGEAWDADRVEAHLNAVGRYRIDGTELPSHVDGDFPAPLVKGAHYNAAQMAEYRRRLAAFKPKR